MLGRVSAIVPAICQQQQRGMATLKTISMRLKSVKNIQKITQSMKMVSAAKYARADRELRRARPYGEGAKQFYSRVDVATPKESLQKLIIAVTSDRGLCGACHTSIARFIRREFISDHEEKNTKIVCVGDKARTLLQHFYSKNIILVASEIGRTPATFLDAGKLTSAILSCDYKYTDGKIIFNKFKSAVAYVTSTMPVYAPAIVEAAPKLMAYELDGDVIQSYIEYSLTCLVYYSLKEGSCSEQSARMTAMGNACSNAEEMIGKLTLVFNRTRQAVITRELTEIISGAAAL